MLKKYIDWYDKYGEGEFCWFGWYLITFLAFCTIGLFALFPTTYILCRIIKNKEVLATPYYAIYYESLVLVPAYIALHGVPIFYKYILPIIPWRLLWKIKSNDGLN